MESCENCKKYRETPRGKEETSNLISRINRIKGQLEGIANMLEENRYCGDVLIQITAAESALRSLGYLIFEEHLATCVAEQIRRGDENIVKETVELAKKLN